MRDHRKLDIFKSADVLVIRIYQVTKTFPKEELYGLVSQMRRASVSVATNIVEGCGRRTETEFNRSKRPITCPDSLTVTLKSSVCQVAALNGTVNPAITVIRYSPICFMFDIP